MHVALIGDHSETVRLQALSLRERGTWGDSKKHPTFDLTSECWSYLAGLRGCRREQLLDAHGNVRAGINVNLRGARVDEIGQVSRRDQKDVQRVVVPPNEIRLRHIIEAQGLHQKKNQYGRLEADIPCGILEDLAEWGTFPGERVNGDWEVEAIDRARQVITLVPTERNGPANRIELNHQEWVQTGASDLGRRSATLDDLPLGLPIPLQRLQDVLLETAATRS